ncbi:MAG: hypothetical protein IKC95_01445 [Oscillospiraceae bacterium]|nr:hypothetical protein [Oscillospiraceae bacterium]
MKNKILTILLSVGLAVALWLYVVTVVSPNSDKHYYNIPITIQSEIVLQERGLMITNRELPTVSLHLEGNRTDLNKLNSSNITVSVDVSRIGEAGTHNLVVVPSYPGDVPNNAITVLSRNPGSITLQIEERISKTVPVEIRYTGALPTNFMADKENKGLDYESIVITGPKSVIDQITVANIDVNLEGRTESISEQYRFSLCNSADEPVDAALVTANVETVKLTLKILQLKEISLKVNAINGGGANDKNTEITVAPGKILVSGSKVLLDSLDSLVLDTINLAEITEDQILVKKIKLPEGVNNETGVDEVEVTIKLPQLSTKSFTVTSIQAINVPAGMAADLITQMLTVTLRGPQASLNKINPADILITGDFSDEQIGSATVKAVVTVNSSDVGAIGVYNVSANLRNAS